MRGGEFRPWGTRTGAAGSALEADLTARFYVRVDVLLKDAGGALDAKNTKPRLLLRKS